MLKRSVCVNEESILKCKNAKPAESVEFPRLYHTSNSCLHIEAGDAKFIDNVVVAKIHLIIPKKPEHFITDGG